MIGMLGHALQLLAKESGLSKKVDDMITAPSKAEVLAKQKKEAAAKRAKERAEQKKHDDELYALAIEMEKERVIETNEKAKDFDDDILLEFATKRLTEQLLARVEEYSNEKETLDAEIAEIDKKIEELNQQMEDAALQEHTNKELGNQFKVEQHRIQKLNSMYETYVSACGKGGTLDDIGVLTIMTAAKRLGVTEEELEELKQFAAKHRFSSAVKYMKELKQPAHKQKNASVSKKIGKAIQKLSEDRESKLSQSELYGELIAVLEKRAPKSDVQPSKRGRSHNKRTDDTAEEIADAQYADEEYPVEETNQDMERHTSAIDVILQTFESCRNIEGLEELYIGQDIPEDKLNNAAESMKIKENEVAILWDTTVFGSAKDGMLVTEKAVYFKNLWEDPKRYTWNRILKLKNSGDGDFSIGNFSFNTSDEDAATAVYDALITSAQIICESVDISK